MKRNKFYLVLNNIGLVAASPCLQSHKLFTLLALSSLFTLLPLAAHAEQSNSSSDRGQLEAILVENKHLQPPDFESNQSISTIGQEWIEVRQASSVMEVLQDVPSVSTYGGPLAGGMGLSIRGFGNNEDLIIRVDGATQNFEKYRYGIGLSIDPELLKEVKVSRGSAILMRGSGALGGVIEMETIDARDLLSAEENWGLKVKYGHRTNNDGNLGSLTLLGRPTESVDVLVSGIKRDTDNIMLPSGDQFPYSEETQQSVLTKVGFHNDFSETEFTYRFSDETGLEYLNVAGGTGNRGVVLRTNEEDSYTFNTKIMPDSDWLDIKATIAYMDKYILDDRPLQSDLFPADVPSGIPGIYQYDIWTAELVNQANFNLFNQLSFLTMGIQYNQEKRQTFELDSGLPKESQPSGVKQSYGAFLRQEIFVGDFVISATLRGDKYSVASADEAKRLLEATGRASTVDFTQISPAFSIDYSAASSPVSVFYNYAELFRAPLIDEYFTRPGLSGGRCRHFEFYQAAGPEPKRGDFASTAEWEAALAVWKSNPANNDNAMCANYYEPEESKNHEIGIAYIANNMFTSADNLSSKLTFFYTEVENTIESIYQDTVTGEISQPGVEVHRGIELETRYDSPTYFGTLTASVLDGYRDPKYSTTHPDPVISDLIIAGIDTRLVDDPPDSLVFTIGRNFKRSNFSIGYRLTAYDDYLITGEERTDVTDCTFVILGCAESASQSGYAIHGVFAVWQPWQRTVVRLNVDNITDKEHHIIGTPAGQKFGTGTDIRISLSHQF